jgi:hypothetical protein
MHVNSTLSREPLVSQVLVGGYQLVLLGEVEMVLFQISEELVEDEAKVLDQVASPAEGEGPQSFKALLLVQVDEELQDDELAEDPVDLEIRGLSHPLKHDRQKSVFPSGGCQGSN